MDICLSEGTKVAVHCHAGRGRTGLIIAAYMIYKLGYTSNAAIKHFKMKRSGSLKKKGQVKTLKIFEKCILFYFFNRKLDLIEGKKIFFDEKKFSLKELIKIQIKIRPVVKDNRERQVPFIVSEILNNLKNLIESRFLAGDKLKASFYDLDNEVFSTPWNQDLELEVEKQKKRFNELGYIKFSEILDLRVTIQLLFEFLEGLKEPAVSEITLKYLQNLIENHMADKNAKLKSLESKEPSKFKVYIFQIIIGS